MNLTNEVVEDFLTYQEIDTEKEFEKFVAHYDISDRQELEEIIVHFGVKGMKWGVTRSDENLAKRKTFAEKTTGDKLLSVGVKSIPGVGWPMGGLITEIVGNYRTAGARRRISEGRGRVNKGKKQTGMTGPDDWNKKSKGEALTTFFVKGPLWAVAEHVSATTPARQGSAWLEGNMKKGSGKK